MKTAKTRIMRKLHEKRYLLLRLRFYGHMLGTNRL